ncbi:unnamed protein product [Effrenium voratum]|nr:unnamed protein product [Effrenium voratum]
MPFSSGSSLGGKRSSSHDAVSLRSAMNWLRGASAPTTSSCFGAGRYDEGLEGDPESEDSRRPSLSSAQVNPAPPFQVRKPPPPTSTSAEDLRDWVVLSIDCFQEAVQAELSTLRQRFEETEKENGRQFRQLYGSLKHDADLIKRTQAASVAANENAQILEEKVNNLNFDDEKFAHLRQEVREAVQYLDEVKIRRLTSQCSKVEHVLQKSVTKILADCKDLDHRLTLQSVAASTFSLKAIALSEEQRTKSLKYLSGEELRIKERMTGTPRNRLSDEDILLELNTAARPEVSERPLALMSGPGPLEQKSTDGKGVLELLAAEVFVLNAFELDEYHRKMCTEFLNKKASELRGGPTLAVLQEIHSQALRASESDMIPEELVQPVRLSLSGSRPSLTERL